MSESLIKYCCPICKLEYESNENHSSSIRQFINCPRCKKFILDFDAIIAIREDQPAMPKLSAWIREINEREADIPTISSNDILAIRPDYSPREKQIKLLQYIRRNTEYPGKEVTLSIKYDFSIAWASSEEEFCFHINSLGEQGFLKIKINNATGLSHVTITTEGWYYLEQLEKKPIPPVGY